MTSQNSNPLVLAPDVRILSFGESLKFRKFGKTLFEFVFYSVGILGGFLLFMPLAILLAFFALYKFISCIQILSEAFQRKWRAGYCPNCGSKIFFKFVAIDCPICRRRLALRSGGLWDVT
jgi:DNA-directed RNA polymerase subunit RPC12/RpoP